jgi:hypothetical protein
MEAEENERPGEGERIERSEASLEASRTAGGEEVKEDHTEEMKDQWRPKKKDRETTEDQIPSNE